jgi:hypothetical protein
MLAEEAKDEALDRRQLEDTRAKSSAVTEVDLILNLDKGKGRQRELPEGDDDETMKDRNSGMEPQKGKDISRDEGEQDQEAVREENLATTIPRKRQHESDLRYT